MRTLLLWALPSFLLIMAASFTSLGQFLALILALPFQIGGLEGLQIFWFIALFAGVPFFGYVFVLLFPDKYGRLAGILSLTGLWAGLIAGAFVVTELRGLP